LSSISAQSFLESFFLYLDTLHYLLCIQCTLYPTKVRIYLYCSSAKRAGDYYMFDYDPETDELVKPVESFVPEVTPGAGDFDKLDPAQVCIGI
jgi:hypothetical protein